MMDPPLNEESHDGMTDMLEAFRDSARSAAERPDAFWETQRSAVSAALRKSRTTAWRRPALVWVPVAAVVMLCLFLFVENGKAPTPDFAAGSDQDLLIDVQRAVDREYPSAFDPASLITQEIR